MNSHSESNAELKNKAITGWEIVKTAGLNVNKHFFTLVADISFVLLISICMFVPLWIWYVKIFGEGHILVKVFSAMMYFSLCVVVLFMISLSLFNRTNPSEKALKFWTFTKEITWPWLWEGLKASVIILAGLFLFIIPGIVKNVHYTFFSFVVFFDPDYKKRKVSALKRSKKLTEGIRWWVLGLAVILPIFIQTIPNELLLKNIFKINSLWILYPVLTLYVYIICLCFVYIFSVLYFMYIAQDKILNRKN